MPPVRTLALITMTGCVVLGSWALMRPSKPVELSSPGAIKPSEAQVDSASEPSPAQQSARRFQAGERQVYDLDYGMALNAGGQADARKPNLRYRGELALTVESVVGNEVRVEGQLTLKTGSILGDLKQPETLADPFMLALDLDGAVRGIRFSPDTPGDARAVLRAVMGAVQLSLRGAASWTVTEQDATGEYRAHYRRTEARHVTRQVQGYERIITDEGLVSPEIAAHFAGAARSDFSLDAMERLEAMRSDARVELQPMAEGATIRMHCMATLERTRIDRHEVTSEWDRLSARESLSHFAGNNGDSVQPDTDLEGDTFETLVTKIETLDAMPGNEGANLSQSLQFKLGTLARHDPEVVDNLARLLSSREKLEPLAQAVYIGGLAQAGTKEATHSLAVLLDADIDSGRRLVVTSTLGQLRPDQVVIESLQAELESDDPEADTSTARLALGSLAGRMDPSQRGQVDPVADLLAEWNGARGNPEKQRTLLLALGNSGDLRGLAPMEEVLAGNDPSMREVALFAMRRMPAEATDAHYLAALTQPLTIGEHMATLRALEGRDLTLYRDALVALVERTEHEGIVTMVRRLLGGSAA